MAALVNGQIGCPRHRLRVIDGREGENVETLRGPGNGRIGDSVPGVDQEREFPLFPVLQGHAGTYGLRLHIFFKLIAVNQCEGI